MFKKNHHIVLFDGGRKHFLKLESNVEKKLKTIEGHFEENKSVYLHIW